MRTRVALLGAVGYIALAGLSGCGGSSTPTAPSTPPASGCAGTPGQTCLGTSGYIEYGVGELPIVISVPHGGALAPASIPDRTAGTTVTDTNTIELGRAIVEAVRSRTGRTPHVIFCHLRRTKIDANREVGEAAQGNADAVRAWSEYHGFVERAIGDVLGRTGTGLYIDLHGHGHPIARLELGYLLSASELGQPDSTLDAGGLAGSSSLQAILGRTSARFSEVLRGPSSLGGLLGSATPAVPSVPSPAVPAPGSDAYFEGGYSTSRHTRTIPGLQIESHFSGVRDSTASRAEFGRALAEAVVRFLERHAGLVL